MIWYYYAGMAALSALQMFQSGSAAEQSADQAAFAGAMNAAAKNDAAEQERQAAEYAAMVTRQKAYALRSKQISQAAANGVLVGDGSAQALVNHTIALAEEDAFLEFFSGNLRGASLEAQGDNTLLEGRARAGSYIAEGRSRQVAAAGNMLDYGMQAYDSYESKQGGTP